MKRKHFNLILIAVTALMAISAICAYAQKGYVVFRVRDMVTKEPIIGATVRIEGTDNATVTDLDGVASLRGVKPNAVYIVSCVGYKTKTAEIGGGTNFLVELEEDITD